MEGYPPSSCETPIPIGVVMALGSRVTYEAWSNPKRRQKMNMEIRLESTPARIPKNMAAILSFKVFICS